VRNAAAEKKQFMAGLMMVLVCIEDPFAGPLTAVQTDTVE
jgi:hypothetical protein